MGRSAEIVEELRKYDSEREWFEFKENWFKADEFSGSGSDKVEA